MTSVPARRVGVVGLGLMGASLARALKAADAGVRVAAVEPDGAIRARALAEGVADEVAKIASTDPSRIFGFVWIEPLLGDREDAVDYALGDKRLAGVKMIPNQWFPDDERAQCHGERADDHRARAHVAQRRLCHRFLGSENCSCTRTSCGVAPRAGFEPATNRLTAGCSTTELPGNNAELRQRPYNKANLLWKG